MCVCQWIIKVYLLTYLLSYLVTLSPTVLEEAESLDVIAVGEPDLQFVDEDLEVTQRDVGRSSVRAEVHGLIQLSLSCGFVARHVPVNTANTVFY